MTNSADALELWGGVECTVNRTRDGYRDQTILSGHHDRIDDLDLFAELGLSSVRYPVLWERVAPDQPTSCDWSWSDARLARLGELGIRPIVGLVHHGSGPRYTSLVDDSFAIGLGDYAGRVATRYPWIEDWTPVNEPLTTARFSALYGHWYPHHHDERSFWVALLNQVDGTRSAMRAIRRITPQARLIQTDDLGRTYATIRLAGQAGFDNLRRWASWDLLFGRVTRTHPLWRYLAQFDMTERLAVIADDPCPPDIVGVNHYLTSDRFLDHRIDRYPVETHGGNGRTAYADVAAVRVLDPPPVGIDGALREAWQRYRIPLAITEVHNGCTREEQLRWAADAWDTATMLRGEGIDIRAVTAWSLLGSSDWNTLLTAPGAYESGLFDVTTGTPRATALAALWRAMATDAPRHPVAAQPGWWRRSARFEHPPHPRAARASQLEGQRDEAPLMICGATGTLGRAFARACVARGITHVVTDRAMLDLDRPDTIDVLLDDVRPWGVVNATGWVRVDDAEDDEDACHRINATGAIALAAACADRAIASIGFSSDLVFDGGFKRAYVESDHPDPLNSYGRSKSAMEAGCVGLPGALVVRTAAFFSDHDPYNFVVAVLDALADGRRFAAADDSRVTPTFVPALVDAALDLLIDRAEGIWHLTSGEAMSWAELAERVACAAGADPLLIDAVPGATLGWRAPRPRNAALISERGGPVGDVERDIARVVRAHASQQAERNVA